MDRNTRGAQVRVVMTLPAELVAEVDRLVATGAFESRSQAIRSGLEALVAARRRQEVDRAYADVFARFPETDAELADAARLAVRSIHDESWERWW